MIWYRYDITIGIVSGIGITLDIYNIYNQTYLIIMVALNACVFSKIEVKYLFKNYVIF